MHGRHIGIGILAVALAPAGLSAQTTVGTFSGGDVGEGLDLDGTFLYARQAEAGQTTPVVIRDATFLPVVRNVNTGGATVSGNSETPFGGPSYGASANDDALESIQNFVIFDGGAPGTLRIDLDGLTVGQPYKLQLLFNEACCDRGWNTSIEGGAGTPTYPAGQQGDTNPANNAFDGTQTVGVVLTHNFTATDTQLNVVMTGDLAFPDRNPIIDAFTLEVVPEPSALGLLALGGSGLLARRRRRR